MPSGRPRSGRASNTQSWQQTQRGWKTKVYPVEVGCRGFVDRSATRLLKELGIRGQANAAFQCCRAIQSMALDEEERRKAATVAAELRSYPSSSHLSRETIRSLVFYALRVWAEPTPLEFHEVGSPEAADLQIDFLHGYHGDAYPFDGAGGAVGHAFFPSDPLRAGGVHLDAEEEWAFRQPASDGTDLFTVLVHEFGHALGLTHSSSRHSVMRPYYHGPAGDPLHYRLGSQDLEHITQLYGSQFWLFRDLSLQEGYPQPVSALRMAVNLAGTDDNNNDEEEEAGRWGLVWDPEQGPVWGNMGVAKAEKQEDTWTQLLREGVNGITTNGDGSVYLFKADLYWKFMFPGSLPQNGYPRSSAADWLDCPDSSSSSPVVDDLSLSLSPSAGRQELRERWREEKEETEERRRDHGRNRHGNKHKDIQDTGFFSLKRVSSGQTMLDKMLFHQLETAAEVKPILSNPFYGLKAGTEKSVSDRRVPGNVYSFCFSSDISSRLKADEGFSPGLRSKSTVTLDPSAHTLSAERAGHAVEGVSREGTPILDDGILMVQPVKSKAEGGGGGGGTKSGGAVNQTAKGYLELGGKGGGEREAQTSREAEEEDEDEEGDEVEELINFSDSEGSLRSEFLE
ncbi:hypothetical protein L3Q82_005893 [Scortum barcoo]|uniref:Uncharacterized protein n=1 Tax=Scortum barcoo TaxID=214431 RepID=A0ACB8V6W9_9TELE|nr:hypothetical protein L3Q82_005893 [Scortum barcoo]